MQTYTEEENLEFAERTWKKLCRDANRPHLMKPWRSVIGYLVAWTVLVVLATAFITVHLCRG